MSSVKASAVSRYLGGKGWERSEWHPSAQVRGWGYQSSGYKCEDFYDFKHRPVVRVSYIPGDGYRGEVETANALVREKVERLRRVLSVRYDVQLETPDSTFGGDPYLMVVKRKDGKEDE